MDLIQIYCILFKTSNDISLKFGNLAEMAAFTVLSGASFLNYYVGAGFCCGLFSAVKNKITTIVAGFANI